MDCVSTASTPLVWFSCPHCGRLLAMAEAVYGLFFCCPIHGFVQGQRDIGPPVYVVEVA